MSPDRIEQSMPLEKTLLHQDLAEQAAVPSAATEPVSPLGWSIYTRLLAAAAASGLLWLAVAWALGWLP